MIKDLRSDLKFDLDIPLIMVLIKESKAERLIPHKMDKRIAFMAQDKFFDYLGYIEKNIV